MGMLKLLATVAMIQLFWSLSVTSIVSVLPDAQLEQIGLFSGSPGANALDTMGADVEANFSNQLDIPLVSAGALVFYSGNIVIDLMLNFVTALPSMISLLVEAIFIFIPIGGDLQITVKFFFFTVVTVLYVIGLIGFLTNIRSGSAIE